MRDAGEVPLRALGDARAEGVVPALELVADVAPEVEGAVPPGVEGLGRVVDAEVVALVEGAVLDVDLLDDGGCVEGYCLLGVAEGLFGVFV